LGRTRSARSARDPRGTRDPFRKAFLGDEGIEAVCANIGFPSGLLDNNTIIRYILLALTASFAPDGSAVAVTHDRWKGSPTSISGFHVRGSSAAIYSNKPDIPVL
jgi:hypothetical protein